jgi:hypothetical protein
LGNRRPGDHRRDIDSFVFTLTDKDSGTYYNYWIVTGFSFNQFPF